MTDSPDPAPLDRQDLGTVEAGKLGMRTWEEVEERLVEVSRLVSIQLEKRDRRSRRALSAAVIAILLAAIVADWQWRVAENQKIIAMTERARADENAEPYATAAAIAKNEAVRADTNAEYAQRGQAQAEREAAIARSRQLAAQSVAQLYRNQFELVLLLAIESGLATQDVDSDALEAFGAIRSAIAHPGRSARVFYGHTEKVNHATWSQDESIIITSSDDGTARIWYTHMDDLLKAACRRAPRNLSREEWSRLRIGSYRPTCVTAPIPPDTITAIRQQATAFVQDGALVTAAALLNQPNGWLAANGQLEIFGVEANVAIGAVLVEQGRSMRHRANGKFIRCSDLALHPNRYTGEAYQHRRISHRDDSQQRDRFLAFGRNRRFRRHHRSTGRQQRSGRISLSLRGGQPSYMLRLCWQRCTH